MKERNKILFLSIVILGILSSSLRISISVSTVVPQHEAQGTLGSEAILIKKITEGSILSSTFFPLDNLAIISILLLVGLSMIFYALIKYMAERKKGGKITGYNATEKFEDNKDKESEEQFGLKTANDEVIAVGEGYGSKNYSSLNEIKSVKKNASTGKFEVYKDKAGEYRFRLKAINGEVIAAASQGYSSKNSCMTGIKSVKNNASTGKFEVYKDKAGEYRFRLKAINGEVIAAASQGYSSKNSCMTGIKSVKKNAPKASIIELEE